MTSVAGNIFFDSQSSSWIVGVGLASHVPYRYERASRFRSLATGDAASRHTTTSTTGSVCAAADDGSDALRVNHVKCVGQAAPKTLHWYRFHSYLLDDRHSTASTAAVSPGGDRAAPC